MNRITELLKHKKDILSIYYTAGYPNTEDTLPILSALQQSGVDMVEIGMPFSDPLADGPVIQASSLKAIHNGMTIEKLFSQLKEMRSSIHIPVVLMGYFNTVLHFGIDRFIEQCQAAGVDGIILPDLPFDEYLSCYRQKFESVNLCFIPLIAPQTPDERIHHIDCNTSGFIYMVASAGITGNIKTPQQSRTGYFSRIRNMNLNNPMLIGFGINSHASFEHACQYAHGAIVGTAFINEIQQNGIQQKTMASFINNIKTTPNSKQKQTN